MEKLVIIVRGGSIQHIAALSDDVQFQIFDFDDDEAGVGNWHQPDEVLSEEEMEQRIKELKNEFNSQQKAQ